MQLFLGLAVLSSALMVINAQQPGSGFVPVGESPVDTMEVEILQRIIKAKALLLQELRNQAKYLPGSPFVEITDLTAKKPKNQVVTGILYKMYFKANYSTPGRKDTKACAASVIERLGSNGKLELLKDYQTKQKILCR